LDRKHDLVRWPARLRVTRLVLPCLMALVTASWAILYNWVTISRWSGGMLPWVLKRQEISKSSRA